MLIIDRLRNGERIACARLITLVENESEGYVDALKEIQKYTGKAYVIGITGPPGAGKSTLTDKLVKELSKKGKKVGVIAVDPTSSFTRGAILGDRIRMNDNTLDPNVFIRSMGTRGSLGGLSKATANTINILDAYGCDYIIVETVGVGQSEIDIVKTADTVLMIMVPGLGDDIQAIKAGVMEIGDIFAINKADKDGAKKTYREIDAMIDFKKDWKFRPKVSLTVGETGDGIDELILNLKEHEIFMVNSGEIKKRRLSKFKNQISIMIKDEIDKKLDVELKEVDDISDMFSTYQDIVKKIFK